SNNLSSDLQARGLPAAARIDRVFDYGFAVGGPIRQDKLWFFIAPRYWGAYNQLPGAFYNATQHTPFYTPDLSRPAIQQLWDADVPVRVTWQVSPTHKVAVSQTLQWNCFCVQSPSSVKAPEADTNAHYSPTLTQGAWTHTASSRLLLEAGALFVHNGTYATPV